MAKQLSLTSLVSQRREELVIQMKAMHNKMFLRASMRQTFLKDVMLLHIHKDKTDSIELKDIAEQFIVRNQRRKNFFGTL